MSTLMTITLAVLFYVIKNKFVISLALINQQRKIIKLYTKRTDA